VSLGVTDIQVRDDRVTPPEGELMRMAAAKKEPTASALVYSRFAEGWRLCLIMHPRLGMLLPAGGHVEADETTAEAAVREVLEETGLRIRLLPPHRQGGGHGYLSMLCGPVLIGGLASAFGLTAALVLPLALALVIGPRAPASCASAPLDRPRHPAHLQA
jgi:NUDIX domain